MSHASPDWLQWHAPYADPTSPLSRRLAIIQGRLHQALPKVLDKPLQVISICAGQGQDILGVLARYPNAHMVHARLVELDERNVRAAREKVAALALRHVEVIQDDAAVLSAYEGAAPADIVLACGVFGNISNADIYSTIDALPQLCARDAAVIWTRSRRPPDVTPDIRRYLASHGFKEVAFIAPGDALFSVGVNRFDGLPEALQPQHHMFTFIPRE